MAQREKVSKERLLELSASLRHQADDLVRIANEGGSDNSPRALSRRILSSSTSSLYAEESPGKPTAF